MKLLILFIALCSFLSFSNAARILGILQVPTMSHYVVGSTVLKELANRGHDVTIMSPFKSKEKNVKFREIFIEGLQEIGDEFREAFLDTTIVDLFTLFPNYINKQVNVTLRNPAMQKLIKSGEKFDILMVEPFGNEAFFGLSHVFNSHLVVMCTAASFWVNHYTGNVAPVSFVPHGVTTFPDHMTIMQKAKNVLAHLFVTIFNEWFIWPVQKALYEEHFKNVPTFEDTKKNVSLVLVNTHVVFESSRPYLPNMIPVGGVHIQEPKKLPQDLQTYLDNAKEGVIYFSLGSNLHSKYLPKKKQQDILKAFAKLKQKVLWKFEDDSLENIPSNVKIAKWFPQSDILAHPNVKLFITHGGLLSSIEAVYRGVPIIGIPVYGDQYANIANFVSSGYGQSILLNDITTESFAAVIKEVLDNPSYEVNIKRASKIFQDQPDKPINRAVFWIEHILRHNGGKHLRSSAIDTSLIQYLMLDVIGIFVAITSIISFTFYTILKKLCCSKRTESKSKKTKSKKE